MSKVRDNWVLMAVIGFIVIVALYGMRQSNGFNDAPGNRRVELLQERILDKIEANLRNGSTDQLVNLSRAYAYLEGRTP